MSMGFTPINKPRATPPIIQQLEDKAKAKEDNKNGLRDESEKSKANGQGPPLRPAPNDAQVLASRHVQPLTLPTRPASSDSRSPTFQSLQGVTEHPHTQTLPTRTVTSASPRSAHRPSEPLEPLPNFDRGKLRPSSDVHPMTDWLRDLPESVKARMNLGKDPNGQPVFSFREWEYQRLSSVSPYVLDRLKEAVRRDALDENVGKRRPNSDIRDLLVEWDCNYDDYEDNEAWERKHRIPVVFAWLCVRKMRVAINNKKGMWLKDLIPEDQEPEASNGAEKRPRPVSLVGAPPKDLDMKRPRYEGQIPAGITTGFTGVASMPMPPNDTEPSSAINRRPLEYPPM